MIESLIHFYPLVSRRFDRPAAMAVTRSLLPQLPLLPKGIEDDLDPPMDGGLVLRLDGGAVQDLLEFSRIR